MDREAVTWRVELFGGLRIVNTNSVIDRFQTRATECLVAYLALYPGRRHSREVPSTLLWPDAAPEVGRNRLSQAIGWLRPLLEPEGTPRGSVLVADRQSICFDTDRVSSDVAAFEAAVRAVAFASDPSIRREKSEVAVALYTGHLLAGHEEEWIAVERQRLWDLFLRTVTALLEDYRANGLTERVLTQARRALVFDPYSEELHYYVLKTLVERGESAAAWRHFQELDARMQRMEGQAPSARLLGLLPTPVLSRSVVEDAPTVSRRPVLPSLPTRFFGREAERERLRVWLHTLNSPLLTLTGLGGTGKTRLAIEAAREYAAVGAPVYFVALADLRDAEYLPNGIADALRLNPPRHNSSWEVIHAALAENPGLLILDNLEHLADAAIPFLRTLLQAVPDLKLLVTSRQRLGIEGEQEMILSPLLVPTETTFASSSADLLQFPSVQLFLDRARAIRADFALNEKNAAVIHQLCAQLEGLPLAIELCAAWAQTLTPEQMLMHLKKRFELLVSRRRDIPERHRMLRTTLEYSFLLLPPELQDLLLKLSVFRGGWTLEAAVFVCGEEGVPANEMGMLMALTELRERSLLNADAPVEGADVAPEMRFRMLETVRSFAADQRTLAMNAPLRQRHFEYFNRLALRVDAHLSGPDSATFLNRIESEQDNLRAALQGMQEATGGFLPRADVYAGLRLATTLTPFWETRGYLREGQDWLERFCRLCDDYETDAESTLLLAEAQLALGKIRRARGNFPGAEAVLRAGLDRFRVVKNTEGITKVLIVLATVVYLQDDYASAKTVLDEALILARAADNQALIAASVVNLGNIAMDVGDWNRAWAYYNEALLLRTAEGNRLRISDILTNLGLVARYRGEFALAQSFLEQSLLICRDVSNRSGISISLLNLATALRGQGKLSQAMDAIREAMPLAIEVGDKRAFAWCTREAAHICIAGGDRVHGTRLLAASERLRTEIGISFKPADPPERDHAIAIARSVLGEAAFTHHWQLGEKLVVKEIAEQVAELIFS